MARFHNIMVAWAGLLGMVLLAGAALAQEADRTAQQARLFEALDVAGTVAVMREEGLQYGDQIAAEMLPEADAARWAAQVSDIYNVGHMQRLVENELAVQLEGQDLGPILGFFDTDLGHRIVALELDARRAFMDPAVDEAATERAAEARAEGLPIMAQIDGLIADSDLVARNVAGSLNSNLMFLRGLADGGASDLGDDDMIREVWAQAEQTRAETEAWLGAFLLTAYAPLDAAELESYAAFYRTPEGRALNRALFAAFNRMYDELSYLLGQSVAEHLTSVPL